MVVCAVIVYNLRCQHNHPFEGWFKSPADFENQRDRGLVTCPICGSARIERLLHAPRINTGARLDAGHPVSSETVQPKVTHEEFRQVMAAMSQFAAHVRANTENVGERFAEEARAMHYGEKPHRGIRGRADSQTAAELRDEGIEFQALPFPLDGPALN